MNFTAFPDMKFEVIEAVVEGLAAASFERATGTQTGIFTDPANGTVYEPSGRQFDLLAAMQIHYTERRLIRDVHIYWDTSVLRAQLGWT